MRSVVACGLLVEAREHHDGYAGARLVEALQGRESGNVRQPQIQQSHVRTFTAEVRQRDKDHIRTAVTFHPYGRSASCHGRPRVDSIHSGKQPMTYFP